MTASSWASPDDEEQATARYRDEYVWLARDHEFSDSLRTRASLVVTSAERGREGTLLRPGVATGTLDETRNFNGLEFSNDWTFRPQRQRPPTPSVARSAPRTRTTGTRGIRSSRPGGRRGLRTRYRRRTGVRR